MKFLKLRRFWLATVLIFILGLLASCTGTRTLMMTAPSKPKGQTAKPLIEAKSVAAWEATKPRLRNMFEVQIYGDIPGDFETTQISRRDINSHDYSATIEEVELEHPYGRNYKAVIVTPKTINNPIPVIMVENFCPNHNVVPVEGVSKPEATRFDCGDDGIMSKVFGYFFGRYITTPPIEMIVERGYALAIIFPSDTYPDNAQRFFQERQETDKNWGTIGAWAYQFSSLSNYLKKDGRFSKTVAYGHSRYGKSALVAAAFDPTIDGVMAHQSGTGGASLSKNKEGETVEDITKAYPHWFINDFREDSLTIDQHHLLALIAPRPILLGNAKRDVWSDPEGAFKAAIGANPVYELYSSGGLRQRELTGFDPNADIAFWMRPGTHGVVEEDWPAFLKFMDAHFKE